MAASKVREPYPAFKFLQTAVSNLTTKSILFRSAQGSVYIAIISANPLSRLTLHSKFGNAVHDIVPLGLE
jgi:hypothetical protein